MNNIKKIINLIKKTNDKVIITDENGEASFVLMPFIDYEKIIDNSGSVKDLSEKELLNQIDRDIAIWKQEHADEEDNLPFGDPLGDENDFDDDIVQETKSDDQSDNLNNKDNFDWDDDEYEDDIDEDFKITKETDKPVKYEDIPPPPDITASDIFTQEEKPIIDMSYDDVDDENKTNEFEEEPIY